MEDVATKYKPQRLLLKGLGYMDLYNDIALPTVFVDDVVAWTTTLITVKHTNKQTHTHTHRYTYRQTDRPTDTNTHTDQSKMLCSHVFSVHHL